MANPFAVAAGLTRQASYYRGASFDRLNADWVYGRVSADTTLRYDAQTLRNRARELTSNNSTAAAVPRLFVENVVGKDGIVLQPMIETSRGDPNERINGRIKDAWDRWGEKGMCTTDGQLSWVQCQEMFVQNKIVDGEVLVHLVRGFDNPFSFAIDFVDPDQLDHYINLYPTTGANMVRMGIEMDSWFRPVAYHLWTNHPTEALPRKRVRVPATEILHSFYRFRPRQSRGVSLFAPVVFDMKMLSGYREAELVAARTASAKMGFFQSKSEDGMPMAPNPGDPAEEIELQAEPGVFEQLPPGVEFQPWDPQHPTAQFDAFDKAIIRSVASGLRLSYMSLSGDLHGTSYGSGRIGMLNERVVFQTHQTRMIEDFCDPIYRAWLQMAVLSGELQLGTTDTREIARQRRWHPRSFPWIDPRNDIEAATREVALGVNSLTRIAGERGVDFQENLEERARELELGRRLNVPLVLDTGSRISGPGFDSTQNEDPTGADVTAPDAEDPSSGAGGGPPSSNRNGNGTHTHLNRLIPL